MALAGALFGCESLVFAPSDGIDGLEPGAGTDTAAVCTGATVSSPTPLRRLTREQYENGLLQLLGHRVFEAVAAPLGVLPADGGSEYRLPSMDDRVQQGHVTAYFNVAGAATDFILSDAEALREVLGPCADASSLTRSCAETFVRDFGRRAFRRPVIDEEVSSLLASYNADSVDATFRPILIRMLMAPDFLYVIEPTDGGRLDAFQLATRLSLLLLRTPPDDELLDAASSGELLDETGFAREVTRLLESDRAHETIQTLFRNWSGIGRLRGFGDGEKFQALAGDLNPDLGLYDDMVEEVSDLIDYVLYEENGSYTDLLTSSVNVTQSPRLAELYGVEPWDGNSRPGVLPEGERSGIATRAAFLVQSSGETHPIRRGLLIRELLLCDHIGEPEAEDLPPDALDLPPSDVPRTARERWAEKTAPQECSSCHRFFNEIGYIMESYDGFGRYRTEEEIFDDDGTLLAALPIDTAAVPLLNSGDESVIEDPEALIAAVAGNERVGPCFSKTLFRFVYNRDEDTARDACTLEEASAAISNGTPFLDVIQEMVMSDSFQTRRAD